MAIIVIKIIIIAKMSIKMQSTYKHHYAKTDDSIVKMDKVTIAQFWPNVDIVIGQKDCESHEEIFFRGRYYYPL